MADYEEPDLPVAGNAVSTSGFGFKARNSIIWLKEQVDALISIVSYRQGGSATDWNTAGTTNYTPTKSKIQTGTREFAFAGQSGMGFTITFPVEFSAIPQVYVSLVKPVSTEAKKITTAYVTTASPVTTTTCQIYCDATSTATVTVYVNWWAVGPIA